MRYNGHMQNHFRSCVLLARARDPHRNREVELRAIPGEFEVIGVSDGVDAWVACVAGDPFSVGITRIIEKYRTTGMAPITSCPTRRVLPPEVIASVKNPQLRYRNVTA